MRLLNLKLENWSCHSNLDVDLSYGLQIEGRNGTGKSSVLEAVRFVFKKTASGYTNRIKNGERHALVQLSFSKDGKNYVVEKHLYIDKPSTALMLCENTQVADNPTSVYNALQRMLPEDVLDKLIYVPQNQITLVLDKLSGKEGKVELDRLFGLDKLERIWEEIGLEVNDAETRKGVLSDHLKKYPENAENEFEKRIAELGKAAEDCKKNIDDNRKQESEASAKLKAAEEKLAAMNENRKQIEAAKTELNKLNVQEEGCRKDLENIKQRIVELSFKKSQLEKTIEDRKGLEKYRSIRTLLRERKLLSDKLGALGDLKDEKERVLVLEKVLEKKKELDETRTLVEGALKAAEKSFNEKTIELKRQMEYFIELESLRKNAKCPRCGQLLSEFHLKDEKTVTAERIENLKKAAIESEKQLNETGRISDEAKNLSTNLRDNEVELKHIKELVDKHDKSEESLKAGLENVNRRLAAAGYNGEELNDVEAKVDELSRIEARISGLEPEVRQLDNILENENKLSEELLLITKSRVELQAKINSIKYDEQAFEELKRDRDGTLESKYLLASKIKNIEKDSDNLKKEITDIESKKKDYLEIKKNHDEISRKTILLKSAREIFHRDKGLAKYLREKFVGQLNSKITYYFKMFNQKPQYAEVSFDKEYSIQFKTTTGTIGLEQISGGEKIQLALALRIALLDIMSPIKLLILDEPFGSLDGEHREVLGETLSRIAESGQLILVTHVHVDSLQLPSRLDLGGY